MVTRGRRAQNPPLAERRLTYEHAGATRPGESDWPSTAAGFRRLETTHPVAPSDANWVELTQDLLRWAVKTRSGFTVDGSSAPAKVEVGGRHWVSATVGPLTVVEPVEVVTVVDTPDRIGFAYGTLAGHPVSGEEAFILHRDPTGRIWLTLRSLTRPAPGGIWLPAFPALLVAQQIYRRRYGRALTADRA